MKQRDPHLGAYVVLGCVVVVFFVTYLVVAPVAFMLILGPM